jgi:putative membrane protein
MASDGVSGQAERSGEIIYSATGTAEQLEYFAVGAGRQPAARVASGHRLPPSAEASRPACYSRYINKTFDLLRLSSHAPPAGPGPLDQFTLLRRYPILYRSVAILLGSAAAVAFAPAPRHHQDLTDANIVAIFDAANTADIETGSLAVKRASSKEVRELGQTFADAHQSVRQQGRDLAAKLGVVPVLPAGDQGAAQHAAAMAALKGKTGAAFDRAFLDDEIAFHQAVIDAVTTTLLPAIQNQELKAFVEKIAPAFVGHLEMAKNLRAKLGSA